MAYHIQEKQEHERHGNNIPEIPEDIGVELYERQYGSRYSDITTLCKATTLMDHLKGLFVDSQLKRKIVR